MDSNLDTLSITVALPTEIWEAILSNLTEPEDVAHLWATVRKVNKMFHDLVETLAIPWLKRMRLLILNHYQSAMLLKFDHFSAIDPDQLILTLASQPLEIDGVLPYLDSLKDRQYPRSNINCFILIEGVVNDALLPINSRDDHGTFKISFAWRLMLSHLFAEEASYQRSIALPQQTQHTLPQKLLDTADKAFSPDSNPYLSPIVRIPDGFASIYAARRQQRRRRITQRLPGIDYSRVHRFAIDKAYEPWEKEPLVYAELLRCAERDRLRRQRAGRRSLQEIETHFDKWYMGFCGS